MDRIGLIGVGNIGGFFCRTLIEKGWALTAYDIDPARAAQAGELGAEVADTPAGVAEAAEVILLALPGSHCVEQAMEGRALSQSGAFDAGETSPDGILPALRPGRLVIDTGTSRPETAARYDRLCADRDAGFIDAPITWRRDGLIIMSGGEERWFERGRPVLEAVSYKLRHVGPIGAGQKLKLVNQLVLAEQLAAWAESVEFATTAGIDPHMLEDVLEFEVPQVLYGDDFGEGGHLALHYKDLGYILAMAHDTGAHIPVANAVHEAFKAAKIAGDPAWTQPGIATYWRRLNEQRES